MTSEKKTSEHAVVLRFAKYNQSVAASSWISSHRR